MVNVHGTVIDWSRGGHILSATSLTQHVTRRAQTRYLSAGRRRPRPGPASGTGIVRNVHQELHREPLGPVNNYHRVLPGHLAHADQQNPFHMYAGEEDRSN